jgi:hypothetical protein
VTVIFLEGGRPTFGPKAAELTGQFYRSMYERNYFQPKQPLPEGGAESVAQQTGSGAN